MMEPQKLEEQNSKKYTQPDNTSSNLEKDITCRDAIIWVGQSYVKVLCNLHPPKDPRYPFYYSYCFLTPRGKERCCYVHEAESRGCCRKVPGILPWMKPGKSRIFLTHRCLYKKNIHHKRKDYRACGCLFGYFVLKRIEVITDPEVYETILQGQLPWIPQLCEDIIHAALERIKESELGTLRGKNRGILKEKVSKEFEERWIGRFIQRFTTGENVVFRSRTKHVWPENEEEITELDPLLEDLLEESIEELVEHLQDHENGKYILVPKSVSKMETDRCCLGLRRLKEGSVYLVDALTAKITNEFMKNVAKKKPKTKADGEELFKETVNEVNQNYVRWKKTVIPSTLKNKAGIRGELVLFKKIRYRYPIFEKRPRASFLGLLRVNGKKLIEEVRTWYGQKGKYVPRIPYCGKKDRWKLTEFASKFGLTKVFARRVLRNYRDTLKCLPVGDALIFSGVGEFIMTDDGLQFEPYQHTCLK